VIVTVGWETTYRYSNPVRLLHTELRVVPRNASTQRVLSARLSLDPSGDPRTLTDVFGNTFHHVDFLQPMEQLSVAVTAEVETTATPEPAGATSPLLDRIYRAPTVRAPFDSALAAVAPRGLGELAPAVAGAAVMRAIHQHFRYEVGASLVTHTAVDLVASGAGVCQDFAHLALTLLRMAGFSVRYVSGYLAPDAGQAIASASHAWFEVLEGDAWYGFDPANGVPQDERYVVTAVGRDYDDVPPLRGTYSGVAEERWSTSVRVGTETQ
jgi:transglutaminase-like putative cysteine protease